MANRIELGVCMMVTRELLPCRLVSMGPGSPPAERKSSLDFKSFRLAFGGWEGKRIHNYVSAYSGGDPGGPGGQRTPHFPEWGVTYKAVTPRF